jgi:branched-chain amino acid transport system substrate-binding protein
MRRGKAGLTALICTALVAVVAGCGSSGSSGGSASTEGVTKTSITLGTHQPLTGPAAPGYSEIAPAEQAYFNYINSQGGINGRKIHLLIRDDGYNPANTVSVVHQLVLQNKVFAILSGLGTPTHTKVVGFLNSEKVPDLFVASGCLCWNQPSSQPETFGWQPDYLLEGKILGQYIAQHFAGKKVAYFLQNDDFGADGAKGLDMEIPKSQVVSRQFYQPTNTNVAPQITAMKSAGAQVIASFSIPAFTALAELTSIKLGYKAQMVVSNVGSDPLTLTGLLSAFSKGAAGPALIQGMITDAYLPSPAGTPSNSWVTLFKKVHDQYDAKAPFDGNVEYGLAAAYTFAQVLKRAGANPTRASVVKAVEAGNLAGPGLAPFRYSASSHAGYTGAQVGVIKGEGISPLGPVQSTDDGSGSITTVTTAQPQAPANGIPTS